MTWQDPTPVGVVGDGGDGRRGPGATGHPEVDMVIAGLADLPVTALHDQVARYTDAHRALQQTLRTIDET